MRKIILSIATLATLASASQVGIDGRTYKVEGADPVSLVTGYVSLDKQVEIMPNLTFGAELFGLKYGLFVDDNKVFDRETASLTNLYLNYATPKYFGKIGRYDINNALVNSQRDSRYNYLIPNTFQGAEVGFTNLNGFSGTIGAFTKMGGLDATHSLATLGDFIDADKVLDPVFGSGGDFDAVIYGKLGYSIGKYSASLEATYSDYLTSIYGDLNCKNEKSFGSLQFLTQKTDNDVIDSYAIGGKYGREFSIFGKNVVGSLAYSYTDAPMIGFAYGSDPLFTSMIGMQGYDDSSLHMLKAMAEFKPLDKSSVVFSLGYKNGDNTEAWGADISTSYNIKPNWKIVTSASYVDPMGDDKSPKRGSVQVGTVYTF